MTASAALAERGYSPARKCRRKGLKQWNPRLRAAPHLPAPRLKGKLRQQASKAGRKQTRIGCS